MFEIEVSLIMSLRSASSVILIAPNTISKHFSNHECISLLALKRSATTSHFPSAYTFPGGNTDPADQDNEWLSVLPLDQLNVNMNIVGQKTLSTDLQDHQITKAISLRITAIRETFEECGILLCKQKTEKPSLKVSHFHLKNSNSWRKKIQEDPRQFLNLCQSYNCFPNVKGLHFLSNWITPVHLSRRYDCKFFIAVFNKTVEGEADGIEIESMEWRPASYFLQDKEVFLPPPQLYEISKLVKFQNIDTLCNFVANMDVYECEPFLPCFMYLNDGMVIFLPGDEKYEEMSILLSKNKSDIDFTLTDYRGSVMHRIEYKNGKGNVIIQNCSPRNHDLFNITFPKSNSKL